MQNFESEKLKMRHQIEDKNQWQTFLPILNMFHLRHIN